jgi:RNA polymerase sigma factor (sigma-70 family)
MTGKQRRAALWSTVRRPRSADYKRLYGTLKCWVAHADEREQREDAAEQEWDEAAAMELLPDTEEQTHREVACVWLDHALTMLTEREQCVLIAWFGLSGNRQTATEIGDEMGVTRSRVMQIQQKALRRLRHPALFHDDETRAYLDEWKGRPSEPFEDRRSRAARLTKQFIKDSRAAAEKRRKARGQWPFHPDSKEA